MELFGYIGWITLPEFILQFMSFSVETLDQWVAAQRLYWWIILGVGLGLFVVGLVFGGIGLFTLGKRAGIKHAWIGFLPFANTYLTGEIAGEARMFNTKVKRIGLWAMLTEILFVALNVFDIVLQILLLRVEYFTPVVNEVTGQITGYAIDATLVPEAVRWMATAANVIYIIEYVFSLLVIFVFCMMFSAFYRKYYARNPFMMTFLSAVLPGRGFAIFAVRNNPPVDYEALMRRRMQQQQQQYNPYGAPYGGQPYNGQPYGGQPYNGQPNGQPQQGAPEEPFSDFGGSGNGGSGNGGSGNGTPPGGNDSPFSDF